MSDEGSAYKLHLGDCFEVMKTMESNSVDSICCDPPYGLSFMGAEFDTFHKEDVSDNVAFQQIMTPIFAEALRVAKPGAYLLAFGGTRTYHRLACAIEDAGWEIRDSIAWVYGCLSEDTEIYTSNGWARIGTIHIGDRIYAYDRTTKTIRLEKVKDTYLYDYEDTAYKIQSDSTEQLVSRNHRVIVERGGVEVFEYAENLAQEHEICVPILEGLPNMHDHISYLQQDTSQEKPLLLQEVPTVWSKEDCQTELYMQGLRQSIPYTTKSFEEKRRSNMFAEMQWQTAREGTCGLPQDPPAQENAKGNRRAEATHDRDEEPRMEGRSDLPSPQRKLCECTICAVSRAVSINGEEGRICDGASPSSCKGDREGALADRSGTSHQSQPIRQQKRESDVISDKPSTQTLREVWRTKTTMARIEPIHYKGRMWCVSVPSGAIVARRNGKIFITGNSGFPKGMDVSKAIDKQLGASREKKTIVCGKTSFGLINDDGFKPHRDVDGDEAVTEEAKEWQGWNTQLKPALEPIVVARKPLEGTVADNVMKYGTGAINIDGCRVPTEDVIETKGNRDSAKVYGKYNGMTPRQSEGQKLGRFPANLVHDGSDEVLALFPESKGQCGAVTGNEPSRTGEHGIFGAYGAQNIMYPRNDTGSAARFFYCAKASRAERGKGNSHITVKPIALMQWLVRLVTRKGGMVLDPFMGSGTTGIAAIKEGMDFTGIEISEEYYNIAKKRIEEESAKPVQEELF